MKKEWRFLKKEAGGLWLLDQFRGSRGTVEECEETKVQSRRERGETKSLGLLENQRFS